MDNLQTDDIGRLLMQLNLDQSRYRVFRSASSSRFPASSQEHSAEAAQSPLEQLAPPPLEIAEKVVAFQKAPLPRRIEASPERVPERVPERMPERVFDRAIQPRNEEWSVLESLFKLNVSISGGRASDERSEPALLRGTTVFGACGGVGTTSILAALGKIAAKSAQRVLLIDSASPSVLPFYFGGQSTRSFISTFTPSNQAREQPIHIACGKADKPLRALASEIDRFYVDGGLFRARETRDAREESSLLVILPDTRCLAELQRLDRQEAKPPFLLLNQYDAHQPLHREIQYLLGQKYRDRLIPVTLGYDSDVSVAIAQGKTIIDYSPDSRVTSDLYRLDEWLTHNFNSRSSPTLELAAAGKRL